MRFFGPRSVRRPNDPRELRRRASRAMRDGDHRTAYDCYIKLEAQSPEDPSLALKAADCARRIGAHTDQVRALERAAQGYEKAGLARKAVAVFKMMLAADPTHASAAARIDEINRERPRGLDRLGTFRRSPSKRPGAPFADRDDASSIREKRDNKRAS